MRSPPTCWWCSAALKIGVGAAAIALTLSAPATAHDHRPKGKHPHHGQEVRFATFNASLNRATEGQLEQDLSTGDNEQARNVAETLFAWDTASGLMPLDYSAVVLAVGDPSGAEQAGLASDIAAYLPTREAWVELRQYATTQHLEITDAFVPGAWATAQEQAQPGQLVEGTTAITIEGVRHRAGVLNDEPVDSAHEVAFTVFVVCEPAYDTCHLLRLSELDNPLR